MNLGRLLCRIGWHHVTIKTVIDKFDDGDGGETWRVIDYEWCRRHDCPTFYKPVVMSQEIKQWPRVGTR